MTDSPTLTRLRALRELLSAPERWTQRAFATTGGGTKVDPTGPSASKWCIYGACIKVGDSREILNALGFKNWLKAVHFNDTHTHAEVLALIDWAIERLTKESA